MHRLPRRHYICTHWSASGHSARKTSLHLQHSGRELMQSLHIRSYSETPLSIECFRSDDSTKTLLLTNILWMLYRQFQSELLLAHETSLLDRERACGCGATTAPGSLYSLHSL